MTTRLLVGDVFERMAELEDHSFDFICCSPPFLALRCYLPDDHPQKHLEIGSEATPADYLDVLLALSAEWRRLLAPHGSIAIELGDTYAGSGGAGGDYGENGLREGQPKFRQAANWGDGKWGGDAQAGRSYGSGRGDGWPLPKSLTGIPTLYAWSLAYGRNLLTGQPSPAGRWRIRNLKPWIRSNPPVGALGDKERPATSYITVACTGTTRWFDLDAVRTGSLDTNPRNTNGPKAVGHDDPEHMRRYFDTRTTNPGGAPPLDWWHPIDAIIDHILPALNGTTIEPNLFGYDPKAPENKDATKGTHIRRALTNAGHLTDGDYYDISSKGYAGAHYAVWPPELVRLLVEEMCPRRVCTVCGEPSHRIVETRRIQSRTRSNADDARQLAVHGKTLDNYAAHGDTHRNTVGWSDCDCPGDHWRPGRVLDPFVGSGTTLAVASGMGRDSIGIDLDTRNAVLALDRVGFFLDITWPDPDFTLTTLPRGGGDYRQWATDQQAERIITMLVEGLHTGHGPRLAEIPVVARRNGRPVVDVPGQVGLFEEATA